MSLLTGVSTRLPSVRFAIWLIAAFIGLPTAFSQGNPVQFPSPVQVRNVSKIQSGANMAVAGYFNTEKRLDIVFSGPGIPGHSGFFGNTALNQGYGKFQVVPSQLSAAFQAPGPSLAADLNGDGISDVVSWNALASGPVDEETGLQIAFGKGDGTFINPTFIQVGSMNYTTNTSVRVANAVAADFDANGSTDLAVLTSSNLTSNNTLITFLNDGRGHFHKAFTYKVPAPVSLGAFTAIGAGDINGDTLPDVVLAGGGKVTPYFSTHGGALTKGTTYSVPNALGIPVIADINNDGHGDVAVPTTTGVKFLLGSASGQLTSGTTIRVPYGALPTVFADFNKDGNIDLAVAANVPGSNSINVYFGKGNGTFNDPRVYSTPNFTVSLLAGDFYGTGNMDLVAFAYFSASLYVFRNPGNGYFQAAPISYSNNATGIVAGDFNRDGMQDVAVVNTPTCKVPCNGSVNVLPGTGSNFLLSGKTYPIAMHGAAIAAGDLNRDGIVDLVVVNAIPGDSADTSVLLGKADGSFQAARNYTLGSPSYQVVLEDMNRDGKLDLVTDGGVALGRGDGTFSAPRPFPNGYLVEFNFAAGITFAVGDVNGDGKLDVVVANLGQPVMQVLVGDGTGGFTLGNLIDSELLSQRVRSIALGRLRSGGPLDIVYSFADYAENSGAAGLAGDGHGGFATRFDISVGGGPDPFEFGPVVLADFNGDGKLDVGIGAQGFFAVSRGNGNDTFQPQQQFVADIYGVAVVIDPRYGAEVLIPGGIAVADFNRDGRPDAMLTSAFGVTRLYNQTPSPK